LVLYLPNASTRSFEVTVPWGHSMVSKSGQPRFLGEMPDSDCNRGCCTVEQEILKD
jgi:hypothetical protein